MKIIFYGGRQAGVVCLLTILANKHVNSAVVPEDDMVDRVAKSLKLKIYQKETINSPNFCKDVENDKPDLLVCAHGRRLIKTALLSIPKYGCINVHPCLYKYKGATPIARMLADRETKASVAVHQMTDKIDDGEVIIENFVDVGGLNTVLEVYNFLYPLYSITLTEAIGKLEKENKAV